MLVRLKIYFLIQLGAYQKALTLVENLKTENLSLHLVRCYLLAATQKIDDLNGFVHNLKRENSLIFPEWQLIEAYLLVLDNNPKEAIYIYSDLIKNKSYKKKINRITKKLSKFNSSEQVLLNTSFKDFLEVKKINFSRYTLFALFSFVIFLAYLSFVVISDYITSYLTSNPITSSQVFLKNNILYSQQFNETNLNNAYLDRQVLTFLKKSSLLKIDEKKKISQNQFSKKMNYLRKQIITKKINLAVLFYNQIKNSYDLSIGQRQKLEILYNTILVPNFKSFENDFLINDIELKEIPNYYGCYFQVTGIVSKVVINKELSIFNLSILDKNNNVEKTVQVYVKEKIDLSLKKINILARLKGFSTNKKVMIFEAIVIYD